MLKKKVLLKPKPKFAPKRVIFFPYNMGSQGATALCKQLGGLKVFPDKNYVPKQQHIIVNWGNSGLPNWHLPAKTLNHPAMCATAINKLSAFKQLKDGGVSIPLFVTSQADAVKLALDGNVIICRKTLTGSEGKGIVVITPDDVEKMPNCQLYTVYKKKKQEFRVHVLGGKVIDVQEKRQVKGAENVNTLIRNHDNGWVFCRDNVVIPHDCSLEAIKAMAALGLDFGGVDVIYNAHDKKAYVLEVNTAPGLEGTTVNNYAKAFKEFFQQKDWL